MSLSIIILIFLVINISITNVKSESMKDPFLEWGINNNLDISPFIELSTSQEKRKSDL